MSICLNRGDPYLSNRVARMTARLGTVNWHKNSASRQDGVILVVCPLMQRGSWLNISSGVIWKVTLRMDQVSPGPCLEQMRQSSAIVLAQSFGLWHSKKVLFDFLISKVHRPTAFDSCTSVRQRQKLGSIAKAPIITILFS